jgi:hypothetical protein
MLSSSAPEPFLAPFDFVDLATPAYDHQMSFSAISVKLSGGVLHTGFTLTRHDPTQHQTEQRTGATIRNGQHKHSEKVPRVYTQHAT